MGNPINVGAGSKPQNLPVAAKPASPQTPSSGPQFADVMAARLQKSGPVKLPGFNLADPTQSLHEFNDYMGDLLGEVKTALDQGLLVELGSSDPLAQEAREVLTRVQNLVDNMHKRFGI